jgi:hypothetical protein
MSALRKEEPLSTADIAGRQSDTGRPRGDTDLNETNVGPDDRRPPRSAMAGSRDVRSTEEENVFTNAEDADRRGSDDREIRGGEIVSSEEDPTRQSGAPSGSADRQTASTSFAETVPTSVQTPSGRDESPSSAPLFPEDELRNFRARWDQVQTSFVDEPRHAVEQADTLVATVVQRIAEQFAEERAKLEQQWDRGGDVSTEELRQGLKRYRAFFDRLLSF